METYFLLLKLVNLGNITNISILIIKCKTRLIFKEKMANWQIYLLKKRPKNSQFAKNCTKIYPADLDRGCRSCSFQTLKSCVAEAVVLAFLKFNKSFEVGCDDQAWLMVY